MASYVIASQYTLKGCEAPMTMKSCYLKYSQHPEGNLKVNSLLALTIGCVGHINYLSLHTRKVSQNQPAMCIGVISLFLTVNNLYCSLYYECFFFFVMLISSFWAHLELD